MDIVISEVLLEEIERAAEAPWPQECCGLLTGSGPTAGATPGPIEIHGIAPSRNLAARPEAEFEIDPEIWLTISRALDGRRMRIVGLYHSHPNHSRPDAGPAPSARDRAAAWGDGLVWLITQVKEGRAGETGAAVFHEDGGGRFEPAKLRVAGSKRSPR